MGLKRCEPSCSGELLLGDTHGLCRWGCYGRRERERHVSEVRLPIRRGVDLRVCDTRRESTLRGSFLYLSACIFSAGRAAASTSSEGENCRSDSEGQQVLHGLEHLFIQKVE